MRLPDTAHTSRPWRIHELTPDFRLEDVWALPTPGGPGDFPRLVALFTGYDPARGGSGVVKALFALRWRIGAVLGWDERGEGAPGPTLRDRLPVELRGGPDLPSSRDLPFTPVYRTENEWAAEIVNRTAHAVVHLGWVPDGNGYRGQMAVLVKPNGRLGRAYLRAIAPFRHLIVYPTMLRQFGRAWPSRRVSEPV